MKLKSQLPVLHVSGLQELSSKNAASVRKRITAALTGNHRHLEMDMSDTRFIDSSGLGVLIGFQEKLGSKQGGVTLRRPCREVEQMLQFTRLASYFRIVRA